MLRNAGQTECPYQLCNCRVPSECPLEKKCLTKNIVYKAVVTTKEDNEAKEYIGMTANRFKERYGNHKKSFSDPKYENETEFSKYFWKQKNAGKSHSVKWSILKQVPSYTAGEKRCSLCTEEKLCLSKMNSHKTLNRRSELFAKCRHA